MAADGNRSEAVVKCSWAIDTIDGLKAEVEPRVLADRDVRFETEHRSAVVGDLERLHEVGRNVVAAQLIDLQTGIVRVTNQEPGRYGRPGPGSLGQSQLHLPQPL